MTVVLETKDKEKLSCLYSVRLRLISHTQSRCFGITVASGPEQKQPYRNNHTLVPFTLKNVLCIWLLQHFTIPWENKLFGGIATLAEGSKSQHFIFKLPCDVNTHTKIICIQILWLLRRNKKVAEKQRLHTQRKSDSLQGQLKEKTGLWNCQFLSTSQTVSEGEVFAQPFLSLCKGEQGAVSN